MTFMKKETKMDLFGFVFFNVMNYKDALIIEEYIDNINNSEMDKLI